MGACWAEGTASGNCRTRLAWRGTFWRLAWVLPQEQTALHRRRASTDPYHRGEGMHVREMMTIGIEVVDRNDHL